jgi:glycosyltransferase involved in cell wall biosynthesis
MPNLSCYIRTQNEERRIAEVIGAVKQVADEVVIIDSGSTDKTVEICESLGAKVIYNPWPGDGFQKRIGEEACANDWLLDIDGDEIMSPELIAEIKALMAAGEPPESVYEIKMVHAPPAGEPWWDFNPSWRRKLYDRRKHRMPASALWDQLPIPKRKSVAQLKGVIVHYAFLNLTHVVSKYNGRSTMRARDDKRKGRGVLVARLWLGLPLYFIKHLVFRGLWRAGTYGMIFAVLSAYNRWLRDAKMYETMLMEEDQKRKG